MSSCPCGNCNLPLLDPPANQIKAATDANYYGYLAGSSKEVRITDPVTGGQKGSKPERYDLIPVWPLSEVARIYGYGAQKYDEHNWRKGYDWSLSYAALQRHLNQFWAGESYDSESRVHHLASVVFHAMALMEFDNDKKGNDNRWASQPTALSSGGTLRSSVQQPSSSQLQMELSG